tara:strand:- start:2901 stop:3803 length:903 start_codon:yes stop_codon:yes gene_type:complete
MLWTEKYRPTKLEEIIGQDKFVSDASNWKSMPNLLLYGPAGTGKTTAAGVIANLILKEHQQSNYFEVNASDDRKLETVRTTIKDVATSMKVGDVPHKIILLDEMEGMTPDAQNALKRIMERYSSNVRFIITCNHRHKIIPPLQSRCANYAFTSLSESEIKTVLDSILSKEGITHIEEAELNTFIGGLHGDLRRGITEIQASVFSNTPLNIQMERMQEPYAEIRDCIVNRDFNTALNKMHDLIYLSVDMKVVCQNLHEVFVSSDIETAQKFKFLRVIGEAEWRCNNMTPKILASWMIGQMM